MQTEIRPGDDVAGVASSFSSAVSLHSHTMHSEETLAPLPRYVRRIPIIRSLFRQLEERYQAAMGEPFDYGRAFWTPPLPAQESLAVESAQIEERLGLKAFVSLSDHDNIHAATRLRFLRSAAEVPISMEWTIPLGPSFLHIGVHNMPQRRAWDWVREMNSLTARLSPGRLEQLLAGLHESSKTLVVLNHPLWDEPHLGVSAHSNLVGDFLERYGRWIHAFEINGLRPWKENQTVRRMGEEFGLPLVAGGDRHGSAPNTVLNLTNASSFEEFVSEIRQDRRSTILVMPEYGGPHALRYAECALDIIREYPDLNERRRWMDRTFYRRPTGGVVPLSSFWEGDGSRTGNWLLSLTHPLHSRPFRYAVRAALAAYKESAMQGQRV